MDIKKVLENHRLWVQGCAKGVRADLTRANLREANLTRADLTDAVLTDADLNDADLHGADLREADLTRANLRWANLRGANLRGANLREANLTGANLRWANLTGASLPHFQICPQEGAFIAYKALAGKRVAKLLIPDTAARTSSLVGRKCRAEFVEVLEIKDAEGNDVTSAPCTYDDLVYSVGQTVYPDSYDPDIRVECTHGIHFFISRKEAQEYCP